MSNPLIYGKNPIERVVSVEPMDDYCELFIEHSDHIESKIVPHRYWILSHSDLGGCSKLKGNLHYKYGKQFTRWSDYLNYKKKHYNADTYLSFDFKEAFMIKDGVTYFKGLTPKDVSILSFDLETTSLSPNTDSAKVLLISTTYRKNDKIERNLFCYDEYNTQGDMLEAFCEYVRELNPSILTGHNIMGFDLQYLQGIADKEGIKLHLGRDGSAARFDERESKFRKEAAQFIHFKKCRIYGREIIDTMFLSINYDRAARKYISYALKSIIKQEGLEKEDRTFYDANNIRHNYKDPVEWEKIKEYCKDDSDDSLKLFDLMISPFFYLTQSIPKSFQQMNESASGSQLNSMLVRSYLQDGHSIPKADVAEKFEGAISHGVPGIYTNAFKIDVASLYPSIMLEYGVYCKAKDPNKNFLSILEIFTTERLKNKKLFKETNDEKYDYIQNAQKIVINSLYGFMGAEGLNFNYPEGAAFVTKKGREILGQAIEWATGMNYKDWRNTFEEKEDEIEEEVV